MRLFFLSLYFFSALNIFGNIHDEFVQALHEKRYARIRDLLKEGADLEKKDSLGISPLIAMTISGNHDMVQLLLTYGANVRTIDNKGYTALHYAVEYQRLNIAEMLILNGAEINSISNKNETPVYLALNNNNIKIVELLIKNGGEINYIPEIDPIMEDYLNMRVSIRNRLYGLDYLVRSELMEAVFEGNYKLSERLILEGADVNEQNEMGLTALMIAAGTGNSYLTRLLLNKGALITLRDEQGLTAISYSMLSDNTLVIDEFLEIDEIINGNSLFYALFEEKKENLSRLLQKSITADIFDDSKRTLLMYASYLGDYYGVRKILDKKGNVNLKDGNNMSALEYCLLGMKESSEDYYQIASLLIEKGAYSGGLSHSDPEMSLALKGFR